MMYLITPERLLQVKVFALGTGMERWTTDVVQKTTGTFADVRRVMDTNVQDIFLCVKHKIPAMRGAAGGAILNAFSLAGPIGFRDRRVYSASKHTAARWTSSTALEVARRGVQVNAAYPAAIEEAMNYPFPPCQILMLCGSFRQWLRRHVKCQRSNLANG